MTILIIIYIIGNLLNAGAFAVQWAEGELDNFSKWQKVFTIIALSLIGSIPLLVYGIIWVVKKIKAIKWRKK